MLDREYEVAGEGIDGHRVRPVEGEGQAELERVLVEHDDAVAALILQTADPAADRVVHDGGSGQQSMGPFRVSELPLTPPAPLPVSTPMIVPSESGSGAAPWRASITSVPPASR